MCIKPNYLPNPWYFSPANRSMLEKRYPTWFLHDTTNVMQKIPCGVCSECLQARQNEFVQRCYELGKFCYVLFGTLTYSPSEIPWIYVNGRKLKFADIRDFSAFMHRLRKSKLLPPFRYLAVTEYGDDKVDENGVIVRKSKHRPHFHFLLFIPYIYDSNDKTKVNEYKGFEYAKIVEDFIVSDIGWCRNYGDSQHSIFVPLSKFIKAVNSYTYDCHFVTGKDDDKVIYYVTKYVLKFSEYVKRLQSALKLNLPLDEYYKVWKVLRPKLLVSKGLGYASVSGCDWPLTYVDELIDKDITDSIDFFSDSEIEPKFQMEGKQFPLCEYYKKRLMSVDQRIKYHNNKCEAGPFEDECIDKDISLNDYRNEFEKQKTKEANFNYLQKRLQNNLY